MPRQPIGASMTSTAEPVAARRPVERARQVAPVLEALAARSERERTLPQDGVDALASAGLLRMPLPRSLGGEEPDFAELLETWEELARADGSAGWTAMANGSGAAAAAAYLSDDAVAAIFPADPAATVGGQFAPKGVGVASEGGYRVTGSYNFGSGTAHSAYVSVGFIPMIGDAPVTLDNGIPDMRVGFVPRDDVEFTDGWHVMGLAGTGSYDYEARDAFVPDGYHFPLFSREPLRGSPLMRLGMMPVTASGHAAWALGVGRRGLDEIIGMASERQRMGDPSPLAGKATFQKGLAQAEAQLRAARLFVFDAFGCIGETAARGNDPTLEQRADLRLATNFATEAAKHACDFAHEFAGTVAVRDGSVLLRCFLDIHTGAQHAFISEKIYTDVAQVLLGSVDDVLGL